jgi:ferredoxin
MLIVIYPGRTAGQHCRCGTRAGRESWGPVITGLDDVRRQEIDVVRVDPARCQRHNRCTALAPQLFELDGFGYARARGDGTVPKGIAEQGLARAGQLPGACD